MTSTPISTPRERVLAPMWHRLAVALAIPLWIGVSLVAFWNFPGNDAQGEGPGHVIGHITWAAAFLIAARWFWQMRAAFVLPRASRLTMAGMLLAVAAQLLEASGAAVVWATGRSESGNFVLHDFAAAGAGSLAIAVIGMGLLCLAGGTVARRWRLRTASDASAALAGR